MPALFSLIIALSIPTIEGYMLLSLLERRAVILSKVERGFIGFFLGQSLSAFVLFFAVYAGLPMSVWGFAGGHVVIILCLVLLLIFVKQFFTINSQFSIFHFPCLAGRQALSTFNFLRSIKNSIHNHPFLSLILFWLILWTAIKILAGGYDIVIAPSYWDDNYSNWNMRTKVFYENRSLMLHLPKSHELYFGGRAESYPLTVYFTKLWLLFVHGEWSESLINSVSFVWFLGFLGVFFLALKRHLKSIWAIAGTCLLVSVPLVLIHGTNPYTDVFMAAYLFISLHFFYLWLIEKETSRRHALLMLFAFSTAAMTFVKNEALVIFLPTIALLFFVASTMKFRGMLPAITLSKKSLQPLLLWLIPVLSISLPWWIFKTLHTLTFGNHQSILKLQLAFNPEVPIAIEGDLIYTGNFFLLFPLFALLLLITRRYWLHNALSFIIVFITIVFIGEICMYSYTSLATEAIKHTGFARGMIHLVPLIVFVCTFLVHSLFEKEHLINLQ